MKASPGLRSPHLPASLHPTPAGGGKACVDLRSVTWGGLAVWFETAYEGLAVDQFFDGSEMNSGLEGELSADATDPAARVTALVSGLPLHHPHNLR
ncbi:MAG TPA: hypothetical protein VM282_13045 [Acidimicrobiales bacterium]|nr:hypothetical protein [Acidimicrobiales bacterium]